MRIALAGYGIEGQASFHYWKKQGADITIVDEAQPQVPLPQGALSLIGPGAFSRLNDFDMVVRTAGLNPGKIKSSARIWSATNEFFEKCPAPIIGVTGTKGKGTTCSLIASVLRAAGKTVHVVGNIGVPALDVLSKIAPHDIVVYELSSFQLWDLERSPHTAVILMIEPDHLNVHLDMNDYVRAKMHIRSYQEARDRCWYHPQNPYAKQIADSTRDGRAAPFNNSAYAGSVYVAGTSFMRNEKEICTTDALVIPGEHNIENACAALSAACEYIDDYSMVGAGLRSFTGLPHRLKYVREISGVRYYDDSIATTPGSAIAAMAAFPGPKILILGGQSKGVSYESVLDAAASSNVQIVAFGENAERISELADARRVACHAMRRNSTMEATVRAAAELAQPGDTVVLSPAAASFDMYKNYSERGDAFIAAVNRVAGDL